MLDRIKQHAINAFGWRTNRKIVVFESDDWGTIRTANKKALYALEEAGVRVHDCHYMMNDILESRQDLEELFNVLLKHDDGHGNPAIFTGNCLVANPDFAAIEASGFERYAYENCRVTFNNYGDGESVVDLWLKGNELGVYRPQSHGREHLNVSRWMAALQANDPNTHLAFRHKMFGVSGHIVPRKRGSFLAAFDHQDERFPINKSEVVREGLMMFREIMGFPSTTFIAPNYVWDETIEEAVMKGGVQALQGSTAQRLPSIPGQKVKVKRHYQGQKNKNGLHYLLRNAHFEPSSNPNKDWVDTCLKEISVAFRMQKPAIVATHRVNYVGGLESTNRERGLIGLDKLLTRIRKQWPDVVFVSSDQLLKQMIGGSSS